VDRSYLSGASSLEIVAGLTLYVRAMSASVAAPDRLALLVIGEFERSAHFLPARNGSSPAFAGARTD
jgi:hypothetical protein